MRKIIMLTLLMFTVFQLSGYTLALDSSSLAFSTENLDLKIGHLSARLRVGSLSYGGMESRGLIRHLIEPHSEDEIVPHASSLSTPGKINGCILALDNFTIFSTTTVRHGCGMFYKNQGFESFAYYAQNGSDKTLAQGALRYRENMDALYIGMTFKYLRYKVLLSSSIMAKGVANGFISLAYEGVSNSISLAVGDVAPLVMKEERTVASFKYTFNEKSSRLSYSFMLGDPPVYGKEGFSLEYRASFGFKLWGVLLEGETAIERSRKGKVKEARSYKVSWRGLSLRYSPSRGLALSYSNDKISVSYSENKLNVTLKLVVEAQKSKTEIHFDSSKAHSFEIVG